MVLTNKVIIIYTDVLLAFFHTLLGVVGRVCVDDDDDDDEDGSTHTLMYSFRFVVRVTNPCCQLHLHHLPTHLPVKPVLTVNAPVVE